MRMSCDRFPNEKTLSCKCEDGAPSGETSCPFQGLSMNSCTEWGRNGLTLGTKGRSDVFKQGMEPPAKTFLPVEWIRGARQEGLGEAGRHPWMVAMRCSSGPCSQQARSSAQRCKRWQGKPAEVGGMIFSLGCLEWVSLQLTFGPLHAPPPEPRCRSLEFSEPQSLECTFVTYLKLSVVEDIPFSDDLPDPNCRQTSYCLVYHSGSLHQGNRICRLREGDWFILSLSEGVFFLGRSLKIPQIWETRAELGAPDPACILFQLSDLG